MGGFVTNVLKKKVKKLHDGLVRLKEDKRSKKERSSEDRDKSGLYKAEPSEELYEKLVILPEKSQHHGNSGIANNKSSQLSLPIPCSSKNSSNHSQENSLESLRQTPENDSPCSSLDSGISRTPPGFKKLKKLQFSPDCDEIHVFERHTYESSSNMEPCLDNNCVEAQLYKVKVFNVPITEKVKIVQQEHHKIIKSDAQDSSTTIKDLPKIPFSHLRLKQSIVSPKTYNKSSKRTKNIPTKNNFLGNFASSLVDTPPQQSPKVNISKEDSLRCLNKSISSDQDYLTPLKSPPEKPPRTAKDLKPVDWSSINGTKKKSNMDGSEWTFFSCDLADSMMDEIYATPFDMNKDHRPEMSSTPIKDLPTVTEKHLYSEIIPMSSRDTERVLSPVVSSIAKDTSDHVYAQVTPRSSRNVEQHVSAATRNTLETVTETNPESTNNSENNLSCSKEPLPSDLGSTTENDIISKECKDKINMIHRTNWSLKKNEITREHECHSRNKKPEELCLEQKFVVNMFQSRPSKRWEKHVRDMDSHKDHQEKAFDRHVWKRLSLDSKKQKSKGLETNVKMINNNFLDVEREIEKLEKESKSLEMISEKIRRELKRMEQDDNAAYSKILEKEKFRIENHLNKLNNNVDQTSIKLANESKRIECELEQIKSESTEDYNKYNLLKKSRDIQCTRMTQASRALEEIQNRGGKKDWLEVLVAERTLLETSEQVKLLTQQIRDNTYTSIPEPPLHKGTIHLSDIKFPFSKQFRGNSKHEKHYTDFFIMTLSYGTQIFVSEFITGESDPLNFLRNHTFKNVTPDFEIKVKLFSLRLRTSDEYFWEKFTCYNLCPTSQIIYEDLLTRQFQEKTVYKTSFKLCAETTLSRLNINEVSTRLSTKPEVFRKLDNKIEFNLKCEDIDIVAKLSGFLDLGTLCGETYFWERKWCVLDGPNLMLYNYPQEEDFGKPFEQINLEYCFGQIITKVDNCPKRRSFHLRTGRPSDNMNQNMQNPKVHTLKTKPNFTLSKFYFAASNMEDYLRWTVEIEKILNSLSDFKKLAFGEEYAEYLKQ